MQAPPTNDRLVHDSFAELRVVLEWLESSEGRPGTSARAVLVGGWAVYAYNPYFGSYDIDLATNARTRRSLMHHLVTHRGFGKYKDPMSGEIGVVLVTPDGKEVHIDFASLSQDDTIEGTRVRVPMASLVGEATVVRPGGWYVPIPGRTSLLLMKLKAAWDRQWRLDHGTSRDEGREREKVIKDEADVLALVDAEDDERPLNIRVLGSWFEEHPELGDALEATAGDRRAYDFYDRDRGPVERRVRDLIGLTR